MRPRHHAAHAHDLPAPLRPGSRIAVTAPSSGVEPRLHTRLDLVLGHLRAQGFVVEEGRCLRDERHSASASADVRAAELMALLRRDDIDAIIPPWGGELAIELLDRPDGPALAPARPKWVLDDSDTSTWMLPPTLRLGWATAHGPWLMDLAPGQDDALTHGVKGHLATPAGAHFAQRQSTHWQSQWTDFALVPDTTYALTEPTHWWPLNRPAESEIVMAGRLAGGCIDTLMHTAGTAHGDMRGFIGQAGAEGVLLFLEKRRAVADRSGARVASPALGWLARRPGRSADRPHRRAGHECPERAALPRGLAVHAGRPARCWWTWTLGTGRRSCCWCAARWPRCAGRRPRVAAWCRA